MLHVQLKAKIIFEFHYIEAKLWYSQNNKSVRVCLFIRHPGVLVCPRTRDREVASSNPFHARVPA